MRITIDKLMTRCRCGLMTCIQVIASGLISKKAIVMSARDGNFQSLDELTECMKASMLIPGVAGDVVRLKVRTAG